MFDSTEGLCGAGDREQVRVAGHSQAEVGLRAVLPLLRQRPTAAPLDAEFLQRAGQRVEAGGDDEFGGRQGADRGR